MENKLGKIIDVFINQYAFSYTEPLQYDKAVKNILKNPKILDLDNPTANLIRSRMSSFEMTPSLKQG